MIASDGVPLARLGFLRDITRAFDVEARPLTVAIDLNPMVLGVDEMLRRLLGWHRLASLPERFGVEGMRNLLMGR